MPIFRSDDGQLSALTRVSPGPELYESEIEALLWANLEAFTGTDLFPVCRQARVRSGDASMIPDVIALDSTGRVVIFEVKRSIDRGQLAQCLEYAGWGRSTNLDEIASLYPDGTSAFFDAWQEFTGTGSPVVISQEPLLYLIAAEFDERTRSAIGFLEASRVPIDVVAVEAYEDEAGGGRYFHIDSTYDDSPDESGGQVPSSGPRIHMYQGRRLQLADLVDVGVVEVGDRLRWHRATTGETFEATVAEGGRIRLDDGRLCDSPSLAGKLVSGLVAVPGWGVWRIPDRGDQPLSDLRRMFYAKVESGA